MDEGKSWVRAHWRTAVALVLIFGLALFLRLYFVYGIGFVLSDVPCDGIYTPPYSGGSDSYYWDRALCHTYQTGQELNQDPLLNYPLPLQNPRPPLYPWFSLLIGKILSPLFASGWQAVQFVFLLSTGLFGALTVFPTYALGKEAFGRKTGIIAALLLAISVAHLQRSASTDADHDAFTLFFVVATFYFFLRALRTMNRRRWVENWFKRDSIVAGIRAFRRENPTSILYALFSGLCLSAIALAWQGWAYVFVILLVWVAVELFLDRFRNEDTMGTWFLFVIALATPLALSFQWYVVHGQIRVWYDVPAYLFLAAFVFGLAFTVTRDYPWTLVIPSTLVAAVVALGVGVVVNPAVANAFVTGAGYFVQTKVVTTIAEAQAPGLSQMILAFGLFTFGITLVAIAYLVWQIPRRHDPSYNLIVVWAFAAVFMAVTAARFIFNAAPAFAIISGFAVDQILVRADFKTMRRTYRSLSAGNWRNAIRKSLKIRHVLAALGIVFLVVLPNVWWAVDASIPFDLKAQYERQVVDLLPAFLRYPGFNPASPTPFYFGAFGYNIPKATDYYPAAWNWFATQDADQPRELRPAYLSWWDYGFEAVDRGAHPTVADNFQDGVAIAGQFITAQNETEGIALLAIRLLEGDFRRHRSSFSPAVAEALRDAGLSEELFRSVMLRPQDFVSTILAEPVRYGPWARDLQPGNAMFIYLTKLIGHQLDEERVVSLYHAIRRATGFDIGYFAVDARLFPVSAQNTGIFYAPVKLSDHRVIDLPDLRVLPIDFFEIRATTSRGEIPIQFVSPGEDIQNQRIVYRPAFYNSMFYRAYVGYSPTDLGSPEVTEIPGLGQSLASTPPIPAWNLSHFRVVYRTAYYNPFPDPANHTDAWQAVNYDEAERLQANITAGTIKGTVDLNTITTLVNGVVFLRYYDGAWVNGTLFAGSTPLPGVRITVTDELGTPHYVTTTDASGRYSALVPFGDIEITASVGTTTRTTLINSRTLATTKLHVTMDQAMRSPADSDGDGRPDWILTRDLHADAQEVEGTAYHDLNRNGAFDAGEPRVPGAAITLTHREFPYPRSDTSGPDGAFSIADLPPGQYSVDIALNGRTLAGTDLAPTSSDGARDIVVPFSIVSGTTTTEGGDPVASGLAFRDETNGTVMSFASASNGSYRIGPLLAGNYTITAAAGNLEAPPTRIRVANVDRSLNLTLVPAGTVSGMIFVLGSPRPFATIQFQSAADPRTVRTATADGAARYSIRLPAGEWFVSGQHYDSTQLYAVLGRVEVSPGRVAAFDARFLEGVRVNGTVKDPSAAVTNPQAEVGFGTAAGQLWVHTNATGGYVAFLPVGGYDLVAYNRAGAAFASVGFNAHTRRDIALVGSNETVSWRAYRDIDGNGVLDAGEEIAGARIDLRDDQGAHIFLTTPAADALAIPLFRNRTYSGTVSATGFETRTIPSSTPTELQSIVPVALTPLPVVVQGTVLVDGAPLTNRPVTIAATPLDGGAVGASTQSDSNGVYALSLVPGTYALVVDENVSNSRDSRYQNLASVEVVVPVGSTGLVRDLALVIRNRVQGNVTAAGSAVAATITFDGPERKAVSSTPAGYETYLRPGTYTASGNATIGGEDVAFVSTATVPATGNVSFTFANATRVTGRTLFAGIPVPGPMPISFAREGGGAFGVATDPAGSFGTILAPGTYAVTLDGRGTSTEGGVTRFYRYAFSGSLTIPVDQATLTFDIDSSRTLDNTTVSGNVTSAGVRTTATITFTARSGGAIAAQVATNSQGAYRVALAPGTYDVYAIRPFGTVAFLGRLGVPHAAAFGRDLALIPAHRISGITTDDQGVAISVPVTMESAVARFDVTSDADGGFSVLLPVDGYAITASRAGTERGISVVFRATASIRLEEDTVVNLRLEKVVSRSAVLTWDVSERRTVAAGGSVTYTIVVRNSGNVADSLTFSGTPADWEFSFSPATMTLDFGASSPSQTLRVIIRSPPGALVDHGTIQILATSTTDETTVGRVTVEVDIQRVRSLSVSLDASAATFDGKVLDSVVVVRNGGNARETVDVAILNPDDLAVSGWSVQLGTAGGPLSGTVLRNVTVEANSTTRLTLRAESRGGASGSPVVLRVSAQDSAAVAATGTFTLQLPALADGGATITGPGIARAAPIDTLLLAVVIGAASAVAVGLVLSRRRR